MNQTRRTCLAAVLLAPLAAAAAEVKAPTVTFNGSVDSYFTLNIDQPQDYASPTSGFVDPGGGPGLYTSEPGFNLNFAKVAGTLDAGLAGAKLEVGFGKQGLSAGDILVQQAYATVKLGPTTVDAGRFYTPAGFELFDAKDNWTYSKGLLFNFAVPTAHEGVRVAVPLNEQITITGALANGSDLYTNDTGAPRSPYKTGILSATYAREASYGAANFFVSKDPVTEEDAWLIDVVLSQGFGPLSLAVQGDYGKLGDFDWTGIGLWAKYAISDALRIVGRAEWFQDEDGVHTGLPAESFTSLTGGVNWGVGEHVDLRAELRVDMADEDVYGADPADLSGSMPTFTVGAIAWF